MEQNNEVPQQNAAETKPESLPEHVLQARQLDEAGQIVDHASELRLLRKLDWNLIPVLFALYLLSYLDRSNIGNAKIAGMSTDLHFDAAGNDYNWLLTIFYIGYIVFEFLVLFWKLVPPNIFAALCVFLWGVVATLQGSTTNWAGMMALRFLLGTFEAGFGPGVPYYLSFFYRRREIGLRIGLFLSASALAACFAGALAYGITSGTPALANWRVLFLVEGLPSVAMAAVAWFFLPRSIMEARFLDSQDKSTARARGVRQVGVQVFDAEDRLGKGRLDWAEVVVAILDPKNYITALMYFSTNVSFSSLPVFGPTIITEMGFSAIDAQGLSAPPYFLAFLVVIASTFIADRTGQRGFTIAVLSLIGFIGYVILATTSGTGPRYFAVYLAAAGVFPSIINVLPWVLNNQGSDTKRGVGITILNLVGQCGPLLGTRVYPATDAPYYREGMWTCAAFMLFNVFLALALRTYLAYENRRLDQKHGSSGDSDSEVSVENDGPKFRYVL